MKLEDKNRIYFIGIGGIGMSALARHFHHRGHWVSGYDKTETALTKKLIDEGMSVNYGDDIEFLDKIADLVIYTPAIPDDHRQLGYYRERDYSVHKRAEILGIIFNGMKGLAIAGSHGKTSTSALLNHILQTAGYDCASFMGGISTNYRSNYLPGNEWSIAEADEYDRSFHHLHPFGAIITSVDTDHLDVYGNYEAIKRAFGTFARQVREKLVHHVSIPAEVAEQSPEGIINYTYGLDEKADFFPTKIEVRNGKFCYDVATPFGQIEALEMSGGGRHNVENSIGALALAMQIGIDKQQIREAISTYKGVQRRFEIHIQSDSLVYIDDYAHHPREIDVTLDTIRELFPGKRLTVVFQPHLFSRTRDLATGLAVSLSKADEVLLLDIYPAREKPIEGISSEVIYNLLRNSSQLVGKNQVITRLNETAPELLVTMGAGDIDTLVQPIIENFSKT